MNPVQRLLSWAVHNPPPATRLGAILQGAKLVVVGVTFNAILTSPIFLLHFLRAL